MNELGSLREENERLKAALEWALSCPRHLTNDEYKEDLRARAFPEPETEEVEVVVWWCPNCGVTYSHVRLESSNSCCGEYKLVKLTGTRTIPKPRKVKRREEINLVIPWIETVSLSLLPKSLNYVKFFAEWEE